MRCVALTLLLVSRSGWDGGRSAVLELPASGWGMGRASRRLALRGLLCDSSTRVRLGRSRCNSDHTGPVVASPVPSTCCHDSPEKPDQDGSYQQHSESDTDDDGQRGDEPGVFGLSSGVDEYGVGVSPFQARGRLVAGKAPTGPGVLPMCIRD